MYEYFSIFPSVLCCVRMCVCVCIQNTNIFEKLLRSRNLCGTLVVPYLSYLLCLLFAAAADVVSFCEWAAQQQQRWRRCLVCVHVCVGVYVWAKVAKQKRRSGILRALSLFLLLSVCTLSRHSLCVALARLLSPSSAHVCGSGKCECSKKSKSAKEARKPQ